MNQRHKVMTLYYPLRGWQNMETHASGHRHSKEFSGDHVEINDMLEHLLRKHEIETGIRERCSSIVADNLEELLAILPLSR